MTVLYLVRGLPSSGKSSLVKRLKTIFHDHFEADMFFMGDRKYEFDASKLSHAHKWCQDAAEQSISYGIDTYVSNTFTTTSELKPYFEIAKKYGAKVQVIKVESNFEKNDHNVPQTTIDKMKGRFNDDLTSLFEMLNDQV